MNALVVEYLGRQLDDILKPWTFTLTLTFQRGPKPLLDLIWLCEFRFLCLWYSFCGRFFGAHWHFLFCWNCLQTLTTVSKEMRNQISILGSFKDPTPRMAKICFVLFGSPLVLGATASDDSLILFTIFCHFSLLPSQQKKKSLHESPYNLKYNHYCVNVRCNTYGQWCYTWQSHNIYNERNEHVRALILSSLPSLHLPSFLHPHNLRHTDINLWLIIIIIIACKNHYRRTSNTWKNILMIMSIPLPKHDFWKHGLK